MQARSPAFLRPVILADTPYVVRELQPREDRLAIESLVGRPKRLTSALDMLARIAAWDQLRAAGRHGSASIEHLVEFGSDASWRAPMLDAASHCAAQVEQDYAGFETAWRERDARLTALLPT